LQQRRIAREHVDGNRLAERLPRGGLDAIRGNKSQGARERGLAERVILMSNPSVNKRQKERQRQERQREKNAKREERKRDKADRPEGQPGEDPDIAGIVPGPQAPPEWL